MTCATEAVDLRCSAGGATAVDATRPLEHYLRDSRMAALLICVVPDKYRMAGQALLGLEMDQPRLEMTIAARLSRRAAVRRCSLA